MLTAPFTYFGGKRLAVDLVWHGFGIECRNYVEPFFGSGAMLLGAPRKTPKQFTPKCSTEGGRVGVIVAKLLLNSPKENWSG